MTRAETVDPVAEVRRLQHCLSDLISLLAVPASWRGKEPPDILATLLDVLIATLHLDFAAARLDASVGGSVFEVARLPQGRESGIGPDELIPALGPWLVPALPEGPLAVANPLDAGREAMIARFRLGLHEDVGVVLAGSSRPDFPTEMERLLLRVASNQAAIAVQEARRWREQRRIGEELEQRVAVRTAQLTAANRELLQRIAERQRAERRLAAQHAVTHALSGCETLTEAAPALLRAIGEQLGWEWGALWVVDRRTAALHCQTVWHAPGVEAGPLDAASADSRFVPDHGVLGRVWRTAEPLWIPDVVTDAGFLRKAAASTSGLASLVAFPIRIGGDTLGVIEFLSREKREPDEEQLAALTAIGSQIGQFLERKQAEIALRRSEAYLAEAQALTGTGSWARRVPSGVSYWSEEVFRIFGVEPATTRPTPQLLRELWHPADRDATEAAIEAAVRTQQRFDIETRIVRPDGATRHVHILGRPVLDAGGALIEFMGVTMDVTERKRAERALRRAREHTMRARFEAILDERTRLAREMHDTLLQGFTGVALQLVAVAGRVTEPEEAVPALRGVILLAQRTLADARRAVWGLRAPSLADEDLAATLRTVVDDTLRPANLAFTCEVAGTARELPPDTEAVVVRVAQETLANVVKHARARSVSVHAHFGGRSFTLTIRDDGDGFVVDPDFRSYGGHWGLIGMRERASQVRGTIRVTSAPGAGTEVVLRVPYLKAKRTAPSTDGPG